MGHGLTGEAFAGSTSCWSRSSAASSDEHRVQDARIVPQQHVLHHPRFYGTTLAATHCIMVGLHDVHIFVLVV